VNTPAPDFGERPAGEGQGATARDLLLALLVVAALAMHQLLWPYNFETPQWDQWLVGAASRVNTVANVLLFIPIGLLSAWWSMRRRFARRGEPAPGRAVLAAGAVACLLSLLGETLQTAMPTRDSSWLDLLANSTGGVIGALLAAVAQRRLESRRRALREALAIRPYARAAFVAALLLLAAKTAPFNLSGEAIILRGEWHDAARTANWPWQDVVRWARGNADAARGARAEILRSATSLSLLAVFTWIVSRALRADAQRMGDRSSPWIFALPLGLAAAFVLELLQWPVQSRVSDPTDLLAGWVGVALGALADAIAGPVPRATPRPPDGAEPGRVIT